MVRLPIPATAFALIFLLSGAPARAHSGGLDANGCHYDSATHHYHCHGEPRRKRDVNAPAKKSRENVCHDKTSPNYTSLKYFVSYPSMQACVASGGHPAGS